MKAHSENVSVTSTNFININPNDIQPEIIILEPENSLSAILDEKHYLFQEREFKNSQPVLDHLISNQIKQLSHAMLCTTLFELWFYVNQPPLWCPTDYVHYNMPLMYAARILSL
jgi:hypothetical protein